MVILSTEQWIVLAVIFTIGLVLGLTLRSGGAKWRARYEAERDAHTLLRRDYDAHMARHNEALPAERDRLRAGSF